MLRRSLLLLALLAATTRAEDLASELLALWAPQRDWRSHPVVRRHARAVTPAPDAPFSDLYLHWIESRAPLAEATAAIRQRFLAECRRRPELIHECIDLLPETPATFRLVQDWEATKGPDEEASFELWLLCRDPARRRRLFLRAARAELEPDPDDAATLLDAVSETRHPTAWGILGRHAERSDRLGTHAAALLFWRAPDLLSTAALPKLMERGADPTAPIGVRSRALLALKDAAWPGRDAWWQARFLDATLIEEETVAPLVDLATGQPGRWIPVLADVAGRSDIAARTHAALVLLPVAGKTHRPDALRPLLGWVERRDWCDLDESRRLRFLRLLAEVSVEGAAEALARAESDLPIDLARGHQGDPGVAPNLLRRFPEADWDEKPGIARALAASGGYGVVDAAWQVENYAWAKDAARRSLIEQNTDDESGPSDWAVEQHAGRLLGRYLAQAPGAMAGPLGRELVNRLAELEGRPNGTNEELQAMLYSFPTAEPALDFAERLGRGEIPREAMRAALRNRHAIAKHAAERLRAVLAFGGQPAGFAAALLGDPAPLDSADAEAQRALLAAARLARIPLPVDAVARLLGTSDAALLYLESVDTPESRAAIRAHVNDTTLVLGTSYRFGPVPLTPPDWVTESEQPHVDEFRRDDDLRELIVFSSSWDPGNETVLIRRDDRRAEIAWSDAAGREWYRDLGAAEWNALRGFLESNRVDDLPTLPHQAHDGIWHEYLRLTPEGGSRLSINNPGCALPESAIYVKLVDRFGTPLERGEWKLRYALSASQPGLEVLFASRKVNVAAFRLAEGRCYVLIHHDRDRWREAPATWHLLAGDGAGTPVPEPPSPGISAFPEAERPTADVARILGQHLDETCFSPDRRWCIATLKEFEGLFLVDLVAKRARGIPLTNERAPERVAWIDFHQAFLCTRNSTDSPHVLVDPVSGEAREVDGVFRPLHWYGFDDLIPAGEPGVFWATLRGTDIRPDRSTWVGRYDLRTFRFEPVLDFPRMAFDMDEIAVDREAGELYVRYEGHLLRLPLPTR